MQHETSVMKATLVPTPHHHPGFLVLHRIIHSPSFAALGNWTFGSGVGGDHAGCAGLTTSDRFDSLAALLSDPDIHRLLMPYIPGSSNSAGIYDGSPGGLGVLDALISYTVGVPFRLSPLVPFHRTISSYLPQTPQDAGRSLVCLYLFAIQPSLDILVSDYLPFAGLGGPFLDGRQTLNTARVIVSAVVATIRPWLEGIAEGYFHLDLSPSRSTGGSYYTYDGSGVYYYPGSNVGPHRPGPIKLRITPPTPTKPFHPAAAAGPQVPSSILASYSKTLLLQYFDTIAKNVQDPNIVYDDFRNDNSSELSAGARTSRTPYGLTALQRCVAVCICLNIASMVFILVFNKGTRTKTMMLSSFLTLLCLSLLAAGSRFDSN